MKLGYDASIRREHQFYCSVLKEPQEDGRTGKRGSFRRIGFKPYGE